MEKKISNDQSKEYDITPVKNSLLNLLNKQINGENLNKNEINYINKVIDLYPKILQEINFNSERLYQLILKNVRLSTDIMAHLTKTSFFLEYLVIFLEKEFSINFLLTLDFIIQKIELPDNFIIACFKHIIVEIKKESDKLQQKRFKKLFCFFILNLLDFEHITIDIIPNSINEILEENCPEILELKKRIINSKNKK